MSNFFTSTLSVLDYAELEDAFYESLARKALNNRNLSGSEQERKMIELALYRDKSQKFSFTRDLKLEIKDFYSVITELKDYMCFENIQEYITALADKIRDNEDLKVGEMFAHIATVYANALLTKGQQIIANQAFSFASEEIESCLNAEEKSLKNGILKKDKLVLHMEYYYFQREENKTEALSQKNKQEFLNRYFSSLKSYSSVLPQNKIEENFLNKKSRK